MDLELYSASYDLVEDEFLPLDLPDLKGDDIQKLSVIQALPQLVQTEPQATHSRIIPKILQELPNSSCEFHVICSKVFRSLMETQVPVNLLHAVLQGIESRDPIVANAWMETLLSIIGVLTNIQINDEIIPLVNVKSLVSQSVLSRISSCRILGKLAVHRALDPINVKRDVLPLVQSLCQDCHPDVRTSICMQLPQVAQGLGMALIKGNLLTSIVELSSDDNMYVRSASVTAVVNMLPFITLEIRKATILPLVKQLCEKSLKGDHVTASAVAKEMGKLVEGLQPVISLAESIWFLHVYKSLARKGLATIIGEFKSNDTSLDVMCRQFCAANLSAIVSFSVMMMPGQNEVIYLVFQELAADPCYLVRCTVAGNLAEVVQIFGTSCHMIQPDFVRILRDDSEDVLRMLVPQIGNTLELFSTHGMLSRQTTSTATNEIGRAMLKCQLELAKGYNWRLLTQFINQLEHLPNCMPADFIHQHFTPVILNCAVHGRAKPVRCQAVRTLLIFLRFNSKEMQRRWLRENLISQLCYSRNCYTRHIFIRLCESAIDIFSEKYFKDFFYDSLLDLAEDPVANIRLSVANLFSTLNRILALPEDQVHTKRLLEVFDKYELEKDKDVKDTFCRQKEEIKKASQSYNKEAHDKEERKRRDEEDYINDSGKNNMRLNEKKPMSNNKQPGSRPGSVVKHSSSRDISTSRSNSYSRSMSVPPKSPYPTNPSNDMRFLEQHFYIDAGVNLPTERIESDGVGKLTVNSFTSESDSSDVYLSIGETVEGDTNITDDDKVNLRRIPVGLGGKNDKNKRYSSVLSTTCMERKNFDRKSLNRRSLNITAREMSKIPVSCVKRSESIPQIKEIESTSLQVEGNHRSNQSSLKLSHLPVPKRRSASEVRK